MINAFYSAVSGMTGFQNKINISANNMANVNTVGYKEQSASFTDLKYSDIYTLKEDEKQIKGGIGVKITNTSSLMQQGAIQQTGKNLDVAILGQGYFKVKDADNNEFYTRAGNFQIQKRDDENYLVTSNGESVLDDKGDEIKISSTADNVVFRADNEEIEDTSSDSDTENEAQSIEFAKIGVYTFDNPYALALDGYGRLSESEGSGEGKIFYEANIKQGALESSNVDIAGEMTNLIVAQRGFSFNSKVIQSADELENIANNLRG